MKKISLGTHQIHIDSLFPGYGFAVTNNSLTPKQKLIMSLAGPLMGAAVGGLMEYAILGKNFSLKKSPLVIGNLKDLIPLDLGFIKTDGMLVVAALRDMIR